jgi:hypothetical protein
VKILPLPKTWRYIKISNEVNPDIIFGFIIGGFIAGMMAMSIMFLRALI